ncbi:Repressor of RNA polymerase III transcription maf1 [Smittium culicis]|uniref:Repressor of RNA polymerase III transcription maf1 n=1 Tax=Smittium culicis TaxID=133412 RepID=A0A1R1YAQ8_9FUNG|nr:Repressor of RNA polymerase III transcription maf1 [Smittium culicis]OMJ24017.1 Repressor of RNA polymerase III transcription maf1 [Smittium culicis]
MKFLQTPELDSLNELLNFETPSGLYINGRLEVYSCNMSLPLALLLFYFYLCKAAGVDKKLYRYLESKYSEDVFEAKSLSPEQSYINTVYSPFGPLSELSSRKILFYLIATLNASFSDYDFRHNSITSVINTINTTLFNLGGSSYLQQNVLWEEIDNAISLEDCQIFAYNPDSESDPYGDEFPVCSSESVNHTGSAAPSVLSVTPSEFDTSNDIFISEFEPAQKYPLS